MLCCLGLFLGNYVGSMLGGPWTIIAPAAGFGLGLIGDTRVMRGSHGSHGGFGGGCCGGGHVHDEEVKGAIDPVCGMEVDEKSAKHTTKLRGKTYYFCSQTCMSAFQDDASRYIKISP